MTTLSFAMKDVGILAEHTRNCAEHSPDIEQLFDKKLWREGIELSEDDVFSNGGKHIDPSKVPAGFWLVKDSGIYLMSNGSPGLKENPEDQDSTKQKVFYAKGFDPAKDEDWYDSARYAVGGDDFGIFIPLEWFDIAKRNGKRRFSIKVSGSGHFKLMA